MQRHDVWLLDDDSLLLETIAQGLSEYFNIECFESRQAIFKKLREAENYYPDLLISDYHLSSEYTLIDLLQSAEMQDLKAHCGIIVLSGRPSLDIVRKFLALGVVDFISKPVNLDELAAKSLNAIEMQCSGTAQQEYLGIQLDPKLRKVYLHNEMIAELTGKEFQILDALLEHREQGVSKTELNEEIWSGQSVAPRILSVHLASLRKKIASSGLGVIFDRNHDVYRLEDLLARQSS
ncbi:response regulator transcription factor [Pseudobacteriovorax antillogorgiicola]|uniref:DNA-binding response regulator, OmpR family, contains REC and winged-helix (WHTH) domain n=1 Tax=Pseudobacteriovorax antillogorgiicola TaxID=1513793 RepID=A0A1Y6CF66_9BACT|nr:winged helix-turn-helix domain-containing protein [Pseudobacteriovorax antillogorgiicola]TCS47583.1 DNA-binding response OmpR family regulator [Pseudobacteriovorax antillogorgiicola]SMF60310.1 DNA-binding response regulator, OmpR family, contains REC and winged-helix (wHTH) domain [Pseudobacteriovorax antillogorgiicola]